MDFATSSGLAFAAGINAYLPLLALGLASDFWSKQFYLNPQYSFLGQAWCLAILAVLTLADFFADKIPGVDHAWDAIHTFLRPIAGALVAAAASHSSGGWIPVFLALGASLAAMTHTTKATVRLTSTATTAGFLNIGLSFAEDIFVVLSTLASLIIPHVMLIVVILFVAVFLLVVPRLWRKFRARRQRRQQSRAYSPGPGYDNRDDERTWKV